MASQGRGRRGAGNRGPGRSPQGHRDGEWRGEEAGTEPKRSEKRPEVPRDGLGKMDPTDNLVSACEHLARRVRNPARNPGLRWCQLDRDANQASAATSLH